MSYSIASRGAYIQTLLPLALERGAVLPAAIRTKAGLYVAVRAAAMQEGT
jgi:hypothetical protein